MPRRSRRPSAAEQLSLPLDSRNRPPAAPTSPELLETLAEMLLAAASTMQGGSRDDAREDHR
jgi:hypothetical protein